MKSIWTKVKKFNSGNGGDEKKSEAPQNGGGEALVPVLTTETKSDTEEPQALPQPSQDVALSSKPDIPAGAPASAPPDKNVSTAPGEPASTAGPAAEPAEIKPPSSSGDVTTGWQQKEAELLKKIEELETFSKDAAVEKLKTELKVREEEIDLLKARVANLETELQATLSKPGAKSNQEVVESIKKQHEELLTKARGMIFDKTKMVKNQELQIEALTTQVQSLKDINQITKDLLEIRNSEMQAMEERLAAMEARFKAEKERHALVLKRTETSNNITCDLKKEYETQLALFKELRVKYDERVQALVNENTRLKELNETKAEVKELLAEAKSD